MRDIRGDLQQRVNFYEEQIRAACAHFDSVVQRLQSERDMRISDLKSGLALVEKLMAHENNLMGNVVPLEPAPRPSLSDRQKAANA